jgi:hypothetical protein
MEKFLPHEDVNGEILPQGISGNGDEKAFTIPVSHGDPLNLRVTMFLCNS